MSLERIACIEAFERAEERCDPERLVGRGSLDVIGPLAGRTTYGLALGKAALKIDRKSTRLNSSHQCLSRMPSSA